MSEEIVVITESPVEPVKEVETPVEDPVVDSEPEVFDDFGAEDSVEAKSSDKTLILEDDDEEDYLNEGQDSDKMSIELEIQGKLSSWVDVQQIKKSRSVVVNDIGDVVGVAQHLVSIQEPLDMVDLIDIIETGFPIWKAKVQASGKTVQQEIVEDYIKFSKTATKFAG